MREGGRDVLVLVLLLNDTTLRWEREGRRGNRLFLRFGSRLLHLMGLEVDLKGYIVKFLGLRDWLLFARFRNLFVTRCFSGTLRVL